MRSARLRLAALLAAAGLPAAAAADLSTSVPLSDLIEVVVVDRDVLAIDASGGGDSSERLHLKESVHWTGSRGAVGVALTDERLLAVALRREWRELPWQLEEVPPEAAQLGERVALLVTARRALGFESGGALVERSLGPREGIIATRVGANAAVVVTTRRALALAPGSQGFAELRLGLHERVESVSAGANVATVATDRRILIFRAPTRSWHTRRRNLR